MVWCVVGLIVFLDYTAYRIDLARKVGGAWMDGFTSIGRPLLNLLDVGKQNSAKRVRPDDLTANEFGQLVLIFVFVVFVIVLLAQPNQVARLLPRAFAVALMLGGWLPILTYLSAIGRRLRAPLIIAAVGAIAVVTSIVGDNHDVRLIEGAPPNPISLDQALAPWMDANKCSPDEPKDCPRPVIVAASGGASRAGFFTASVLGQLLDKASTNGLDATAVRKRLFAISSVSGSSVGVVMTVAALAAGGEDTRVPCRQHKFSDGMATWSRTGADAWKA